MKFKRIIFSGIFWRGLYFVTVLLLNIILARYFQAKGSGWIYYVTNYFSLIILVASLSLESGMTYFSSKNSIQINKLANFSLLWSVAVTVIVALLLFFYHTDEEYNRNQFIFFAVTYTFGVLLTSFFCALFFAQKNYVLPNILLATLNIFLSLVLIVFFKGGTNRLSGNVFLNLYFLNFLLQGTVLAIAYLIKNDIFNQWLLPDIAELKKLFKFSLLALFNNLTFFLLYRVDYWFIKYMCKECIDGDLGNYIQVSKIGQLFLLLPVIMASAIFPLSASDINNEISARLPVLARAIIVLYLIVLGFLAAIGWWLFPWVFGSTFNHMYLPFVLLIPGILSLSVVSLLSAYYSGKNRMDINTKGSLIGLIVIAIGDWLLIPKYGIPAAAIVSSAGYFSYLAFFLHAFKNEYKVSTVIFFVPEKSDWKRLQQLFSSSKMK